jgi:hypothetical protein
MTGSEIFVRFRSIGMQSLSNNERYVAARATRFGHSIAHKGTHQMREFILKTDKKRIRTFPRTPLWKGGSPRETGVKKAQLNSYTNEVLL